MKKTYYSYFLVLLIACQSRQEEVPLNLTTLSAAARIIPSAAGYLLVEARANPADPDSPHQLILYDKQKKFVDRIAIQGLVRSAEERQVTVAGYTSSEQLGPLAIVHVDFGHRAKSGGNYGTFLVDSITYHRSTYCITIYSKRPVTQFVTTPYFVNQREYEFIKPDSITLPLQNIYLRPVEADNKFFHVTTRIASTKSDSTVAFYFKSKRIADDFFKQLL